MDPCACWQRFLDHVADEEYEEAMNALEDLKSWLDKGGKSPKAITKNPLVVEHLLQVFNRAFQP